MLRSSKVTMLAGQAQTREPVSRRTRLRRWRVPAVVTACLLAASAGGAAHAQTVGPATACGAGDRGRLLSSSRVTQLTAREVTDVLGKGGLPGEARYGIAAYRELYCTVSTSHRPTIASGLLVLPRGTHGSVPVVSYEHSTVVRKSDAPSEFSTPETQLVSLYFAADGFAVSAPDYLGLGQSSGLHPFVAAASEATATVDLLTATDQASARLGVPLSRTLLATGFSQGGHAVMATGRLLQHSVTRWRLTALAPISGPYDLNAEFPAIFDPAQVDPHRAAGYLAYILIAWNRLYHLYDNPAEVFTEPAASKITSLFDGTHDLNEIAAALPPATELLRPAWHAQILHPTGRFAAAIRRNQVCHWAPQAPVRLYASHGDHDVVFANAQTCLAQIHDVGGRAQLEDMGQVDHVGTAKAALPHIRAWFAQLAG